MDIALQLASVIVSVLLIIMIMLQVRGGGLGSLMGGDSGGVARTRRGLEKTVYQITIIFSIVFLTVSILSVVFSR